MTTPPAAPEFLLNSEKRNFLAIYENGIVVLKRYDFTCQKGDVAKFGQFLLF